VTQFHREDQVRKSGPIFPRAAPARPVLAAGPHLRVARTSCAFVPSRRCRHTHLVAALALAVGMSLVSHALSVLLLIAATIPAVFARGAVSATSSLPGLVWTDTRNRETATPVVHTASCYNYEPTAVALPWKPGTLSVWTCSNLVPPNNFDSIAYTMVGIRRMSSGSLPRQQARIATAAAGSGQRVASARG
jgi:hypothetical protein